MPCPSPSQVGLSAMQRRDLRQREDEHEVEEQLERADPLLVAVVDCSLLGSMACDMLGATNQAPAPMPMQCLGNDARTADSASATPPARIGVSADTLRRWDRAGKLQTVRDAANRRRVSAPGGRAAGRAPAAPPRRRHAVGAQPLPGRGALGRGRRRDGAGGDRGRPAPRSPRRSRATRSRSSAGAGRAGDRGGQGHVGDGGARR